MAECHLLKGYCWCCREVEALEVSKVLLLIIANRFVHRSKVFIEFRYLWCYCSKRCLLCAVAKENILNMQKISFKNRTQLHFLEGNTHIYNHPICWWSKFRFQCRGFTSLFWGMPNLTFFLHSLPKFSGLFYILKKHYYVQI